MLSVSVSVFLRIAIDTKRLSDLLQWLSRFRTWIAQ